MTDSPAIASPSRGRGRRAGVPTGLFALLGLIAVLVAGCFSIEIGPGGYQRQGVWLPAPATPAPAAVPAPPIEAERLRWHPELGVYGVVGHPCLFYRLRTFYRLDSADWATAASLEGPWRAIERSALPPSLRDLERRRCADPETAAPSTVEPPAA